MVMQVTHLLITIRTAQKSCSKLFLGMGLLHLPTPQGFQQKVRICGRYGHVFWMKKQQHKVVYFKQMVSNNNEMKLNAVHTLYISTISKSFVNMVGVKP